MTVRVQIHRGAQLFQLSAVPLQKWPNPTGKDIDNGIRMAEVVESLDAAFEFKY